MSKKLFVGNISWSATEEDLKSLFAQYGDIEEVVIIKDRMTGRSKGFGFVTFVNDDDADEAVSKLDGHALEDRELVVNVARPPKPRY